MEIVVAAKGRILIHLFAIDWETIFLKENPAAGATVVDAPGPVQTRCAPGQRQ
jgi:hypothetical protein